VFNTVKATFRIVPQDAAIDTEQRGVEFEVHVLKPRSEGFRLHWNWGDGNESNGLSLTNASHECDDVGNHTVVAAPGSVDGEVVLAADTVQVTSGLSARNGEVARSMDAVRARTVSTPRIFVSSPVRRASGAKFGAVSRRSQPNPTEFRIPRTR